MIYINVYALNKNGRRCFRTSVTFEGFHFSARRRGKVSFDSHTDVLFKEHGILEFFDIYFYQIGKFMYLFKRGLLPNYFRNMFTLASQLHSHYTRNCNLYYIPPCRTNIRNFSIRFQGPKFFNSLSPEIQNSESIRLFGKRLKKFLLS